MQEIIEKLKERLRAGAAVAVCAESGEIAAFFGNGVRPLLAAALENPALFENAVCADKVAGKAAALLFAYIKARAVHAALLSDSAAAVLEQFNIPYTFDQKVPFIQNRDGTGMCPMEALCAELADPAAAVKALRAKIGI